MNPGLGYEELSERLVALSVEAFIPERLLSAFSVAIALAKQSTVAQLVGQLREASVPRQAVYEIMLQSYLLLGFPRMLMAAETLQQVWPAATGDDGVTRIRPDDCARWLEDGQRLCRRIYAENFDKLRERVTAMAPEIFAWMVLEGYGKVYSRPGVDPVSRELANVAILLVENREQQLHSHMRGALHVGASKSLLRTVIEDIGEPAGGGYRTACRLLSMLREK